MREILFRGKRIDDGAWVEGSLDIVNNDCARILTKDRRELWNIAVIPETIGQFTGLFDKYGKRIFEGDIVLISKKNPKPHYQLWEIKFGYHTATAGDPFDCGEAYGFYIFCQQWQDESITEDEAKKFEVIGNVHDDPELLKERAEL